MRALVRRSGIYDAWAVRMNSAEWSVARSTGTAGNQIHSIAQLTEVRRLVEARGAHLLFLPPYSPDLNPIELAFAKLKALLRKAGERSLDDLWARLGACLDALTPGHGQSTRAFTV